MKKLKKFENFNEIDPYGEENWNTGDINELKLGNDGPEFKAGDRVICEITSNIANIYNSIGTIIDYEGRSKFYLICFDNNIYPESHSDFLLDRYNIPYGHGFYLKSYHVSKIED